VDEETEDEITATDRKNLLERIKHLIQTRKPDVVIFEDYDKGVLKITH
jgi:bifunctional ADP-heptose synthase (sugar kinase/adenylyltransferase)